MLEPLLGIGTRHCDDESPVLVGQAPAILDPCVVASPGHLQLQIPLGGPPNLSCVHSHPRVRRGQEQGNSTCRSSARGREPRGPQSVSSLVQGVQGILQEARWRLLDAGPVEGELFMGPGFAEVSSRCGLPNRGIGDETLGPQALLSAEPILSEGQIADNNWRP